MKIDIKTLNGYKDGMTAEELLELIDSTEFPDIKEVPVAQTPTGKIVRKEVFDKTAHELAEYKRQLRARMSEEEVREQERNAQIQEMQDRIADYERREKISTNKAKFLENGFSAESAASMAEALADSDFDKVFSGIASYRSQIEKDVKDALLKATPVPDAVGNGPKVVTKDDFMKMSTSDQMAYIAEHPNWQSEFAK